jgi:hypothetical protein
VIAARLPWTLAAQPHARGSGIDWTRGVAQAALMGLTVTSLEAVASEAAGYDHTDTLRFLLAMFIMWTTRAMPLAWTAQWGEGRLSPRVLALVFVAEAVLLSISWDGSNQLAAVTREWLGARVPSDAHYLYTLWVMLVYGGAFFVYCLLAQRSLRVRALLSRAELERGRSSAIVDAAQAEALEGRVEPALMLRAVGALREAYTDDRLRAEAMLDALVAFLRQAMPAVRSGRSTLLGELAVLAAYARLVDAVDGGGAVCEIDAVHPERDLPFPPLLLIPLVERLRAAQGPNGQPVRLTLTGDAQAMVLTLDGGVARPWIDETLALRLDRALRSLANPSRPPLRWQTGPSQVLTLVLPLMPANPEEFLHD